MHPPPGGKITSFLSASPRVSISFMNTAPLPGLGKPFLCLLLEQVLITINSPNDAAVNVHHVQRCQRVCVSAGLGRIAVEFWQKLRCFLVPSHCRCSSQVFLDFNEFWCMVLLLLLLFLQL